MSDLIHFYTNYRRRWCIHRRPMSVRGAILSSATVASTFFRADKEVFSSVRVTR